MVGVFLSPGVGDGIMSGVVVWVASDGISWGNEGNGVGKTCVVSWNDEGNKVGKTCVRFVVIAPPQAQSVTPMINNWKERNIVVATYASLCKPIIEQNLGLIQYLTFATIVSL